MVNVSSGTGSRGLSGQNPKSREMVVCMCVKYKVFVHFMELGFILVFI